jgi:hypothetical protein
MGAAVGAVVILSAGLTTTSAPVRAAAGDGSPDQVGVWTAPFEEGGAGTPRCVKGADGRVLCKPVGYAQAILPDGRLLYYNGIEGSENVQYGLLPELAVATRNSRARIMDLRSGVPTWRVPTHEDGGARNPNTRSGDNCGATDPLGVAGVPGRPGDGLIGSAVGGSATGTSTGVEHNPTCTPDTGVENSGDMFCADMSTLADGRIIIVGGSSWYNEPGNGIDTNHGYPYDVGAMELEGLRSARIFNPALNDFQPAAPMKYGRWYPSSASLSDGKVFVTSGATKLIKSTQSSQVRRSEVYDPATNAWTEAYSGPQSENSLPFFPRIILAPNGKVFYGGSGQTWGPFGQAGDEALFGLQQFFNLQTRKWEIAGLNPLGARGGDFMVALPMSAPYDSMTLLSYGGTLGPPPGGVLATTLSQLTTLTKNGQVTNTMTGNLHHGRWFVSGVPLPDGKVLALNGADRDEVFEPGPELAVRTPELYDPATGAWTDMASEARDRTYHNSAILLPDGRVLSGGHSPVPAFYGSHHDLMPGVTDNNDKDPSFQIWSPPYLFYGPRPHLTYAPSHLAWGETTSLRVDDSSTIKSIALMRAPSQQHVIEANARTLNLAFSPVDAHSISITVPPDGVVAPPGLYYLFVNRQNPKGLTPSVARMVFVGNTHDSSNAVQPFPDDFPGVTGGSATTPQDGSYQAGLLGDPGRQANQAVAGNARPLVERGSTANADALGVTSGRIIGFLRAAEGPGPVSVVALLAALSVGLGIRTRRRLTRRRARD